MELTDILVLLGAMTTLLLLTTPKLIRNQLWGATITPLASIIGSGFLIIGPILVIHFGQLALFPMAALSIAGYAFGSAIRYNISAIGEHGSADGLLLQGMERLSSWVLALAYVISVAYYLNLFGSFTARISGPEAGQLARTVTTAIYVVVLIAGFLRGFPMLQRMEQVSVSLKLAIIAGLLAGITLFAAGKWQADELPANHPHWGLWEGTPLVLGLLITVQGFETSRYLGDAYSTRTRIRSMRVAQLIASAIYIFYVALLTLSFENSSIPVRETAIIDMMAPVSALLPAMLILAALNSQFSAAVADTASSGGLFEELTNRRLKPQYGYALIALTGVLLTWATDVFSIINIASRAFALYYALQSMIAAQRAWMRERMPVRRMTFVMSYLFLATLGIAALVFGIPVEA